MGSAFFYRLILFLVLPIAAALFLFGGKEDFEASPAKEKRVLDALPGEKPRPAADLPAGNPASDAAPARIPAEVRPGGEIADHFGRLASAIAAAQAASGNQLAAQARTGQQAQDVLQKLMEEQVRKDPLPLNSPFGESRPADRAR
jgi:hypothetical protein